MQSKRDYFNELAPAWDGIPTPPDAEEKARRFVREALHPADRIVLDLGCGTGILVPALLDHNPARIVECDFAEGMLAENRRKWRDGRIGRVCADALALPFEAESLDAVLCFGVLPHLGHAADAIQELLRCLRPGGTIAVGHLMDSEELNRFHAGLGGPVRNDRIVPARDLALLLRLLGTVPARADECPGWYFVQAEKAAGELPAIEAFPA